jgi:predicted transposase/invertase (TIGR01784 family)
LFLFLKKCQKIVIFAHNFIKTMYLIDKFVNPFTDFGFKKLFGSEPNKDILIDFLNAVVLPEGRKIKDLTYKNPLKLGRSNSDRSAIFDLYCIGQNEEHFIVEMQKAKQNYFKDRSVFYASFPIQEQGLKGNWDYEMSAIYSVGILDFVFDENKKSNLVGEVRHEVKLKDQNCSVFYDKLTFIYLEMPNFTKKLEDCESIYDKWLYVLKYLATMEEVPAKLQERVFKKLFKVAEIAKFKSADRDEYEDSIKRYRDLKATYDYAIMEAAKKAEKAGLAAGTAAGTAAGLAAGTAAGTAAGIAAGIVRGKIEGKIETAKILLRKKLEVDFIHEVTGLPIKQILSLKEEVEQE